MAFLWMCCGKRSDKRVQGPVSLIARDQAALSNQESPTIPPNHPGDWQLICDGNAAMQRAADEEKWKREQEVAQILEEQRLQHMKDQETERVKGEERWRQDMQDETERQRIQESVDRRDEELLRSQQEAVREAEAQMHNHTHQQESVREAEAQLSHQSYEATYTYEPTTSYEPTYVYEPPTSYDTGYSPYGSGSY
jgi:hypothetical protein